MAGQDGSREPPDRPRTTCNVTPKRDGSGNDHGYNSFPGYNTASPRASDARPPTRPGSSGLPGKTAGARVLAPDLLRGLLMMVMALDHAALALHTWEHGTGRVVEADGQAVLRWNTTAAYAVRTLTHLCGAGFTFLLGMGVVYLGRSRARLGWSAARLARYFAVRCAVLTAVMAVFGLVMTGGRVWFLNGVLFSLAVDYLLAGLLWLAMDRTEGWLSLAMARVGKSWTDDGDLAADDDGVTRPLLRARDDTRATAERCAYLSWSIHNVLLAVMSLVTIFWNIWLSDGGGVCALSREDVSTRSSPSSPLLRVWFWVMMDVQSRVVSGFPPLAWLSFALLGMLYARVTTARPWTRRALVLGHVLGAVCFSILFVLTRVLHLGNLSERCLQTPDQQRRPGQNQYLASAASFLYVVKYPPDVAFFALTMAGNLLLLALFTAVPPRVARRFGMLLDFGTSALFFYIVHMVVLFGAGPLVVAAWGRETGVADPMDPEKTRGVDNLFGYFGFYAVTMLVLWPATSNAKDTIGYGTNVVGGVSPGKGGQTHLDLPVFGTVKEAVEQVNPHVSAVFVPAPFAAGAIIEAIEAEVPVVVSVAEHIPVHDLLRVQEVLRTQSRSRLVGPNCPGVIAPGQCRVGIMPFRQYARGCVGIVSKSGTLSYEAVGATTAAGLGQSLVVAVGGDPMPGTSIVDALRVLFEHEETEGVIVIGEIGGEQELRAAEMIREYRRSTPNPKPVVAMVAGQTAPRGKVMGHAGAVLTARDVTAAEKARALEDAGAVLVPHPGVMGSTMKTLLGR